MSEFRPRRAHKKSRGGCKPCKDRHVKCDEMRPQCVNCLTNERQCSYASEQLTLAPRTGTTNASLPQPQSQPVFSLQHMSLLVHVTTHPAEFIMCDELSPAIISDILKPALEIHYLMDALLALSALQHSLQNPSSSTNYRLLSIQLQGRAFSLHNDSAIDSSAHGILPRFIFSLLLGYFSLHDTLSSSQKDMSIFIEKFGDYLPLIHLGKTMARDHWTAIQASEIRHIYLSVGLHPGHSDLISSEVEDDLRTVGLMLTHSDLEQTRLDACQKAVTSLKMACTLYEKNIQHKQLRTQAGATFLVYAPLAFVDALKESQPEALVILAHWGVLLYKCRDSWVVGDCGKQLIRHIVFNLGPKWDRFMELPKEVLSWE
ncbi:hypothetical protein B0J13DRAFT_560286 [Dactylonectria estremocensis]|uniref:Zn(2)-C6 fungal-type domain-containing protein n=1 Tax=Dactylonectria estremocensis TaxID=1079267 RepID=A0A9P9EGB8_9HYPO|nr:hypothetical protein B0J13DRAFT_560286 [Dactylonectria estremocensis]